MPSIARAFVTDAEDSPAYWQIGNLWRVMATGVQTDNSFTLLDQIVHAGGGGGPVTHTHTQDEGLYVISGKCTFNAGGQQGLSGTPGTFVSIPGMTEHSFTVDEPDTHVLNFYLPAGFEQLLIGVAHPALKREPPPADQVEAMLPPKFLSSKLAKDYGQENVLGDPFADPPNPELMYTRPTPGARVFPFTSSVQSAPSYWYKEGSWTVLASASQTGNSYSLFEARLSQGHLFSPHLLVDKDVVYYVLAGELEFLLNNITKVAQRGALVFIPRGTVFAVRVCSEKAHALTLTTPGGTERWIEDLGIPCQPDGSAPKGKEKTDVNAGLRQLLMKNLGLQKIAVASPWD